MKTNKLKKYQYNCQLIDAWLTNQLPPEGGYYKGSSAYLECSSDCLWVGHNQEFLLAVKNRNLFGDHVATLVRPVSDIPFTGSVHDAVSCVASSYTENRSVRFFVAPEARTQRYKFCRIETKSPIGVPTILVPRLTEDMTTCMLESLHPAILAHYDRGFKKHFSRKYGACGTLLGYGVWGWNDPDKHDAVTRRVRQTFNALNIPFNEKWNEMALLRTAKLRLAA